MLTTGEVAKLFQVSAQTVINWLDQGRMPFERIGRGPRRLTEDSVLKYIQEIGISVNALDQEIYQKALKRNHSTNHKFAAVAVAVLDDSFRTIAWNDESSRITGLPAGEALGKMLNELVVELLDKRVGIREWLEEASGTWPRTFRAVHAAKAGGTAKVSITASRYSLPNGAMGFVFTYGRDKQPATDSTSKNPA